MKIMRWEKGKTVPLTDWIDPTPSLLPRAGFPLPREARLQVGRGTRSKEVFLEC